MADAKTVVELLKEKNLLISTAESCTGGLLSGAITAVNGSSSVFEYGVTAYANRIKQIELGVDSGILDEFGAVSSQVAEVMAKGVCRKAASNIGVGITGIAGDSSDNTSKPVGLIYICVSNGEISQTEKFQTDFSSDIRKNNRDFAVAQALRMIEKFITENY